MPCSFPPIYLLPTHLSPAELHRFEDAIASLTYDIQEADLIVGNISKPERAQFELRRHKVDISPCSKISGDVSWSGKATNHKMGEDAEGFPHSKRRKITKDEKDISLLNSADSVKVVRLSWLKDCLAQDVLLPVDDYVILEGCRSVLQEPSDCTDTSTKIFGSILERAAGDYPQEKGDGPSKRHGPLSAGHMHKPLAKPPSLVRQTTSEHERFLPEVPGFLHTTYSCQRPTPVNSPNSNFIKELKDIRTLRLLQGDQIGVRAYSTSIATLAAYPHAITEPFGECDDACHLLSIYR